MNAPGSVKRIFLVDDHPLIRRGLRELFATDPSLCIGGEANSCEHALLEIRRQPPDLVIVDISLPDGSGFDLIKRLRAQWPTLPILVCSMHEEHFFAERALRAGARGYISKIEAPEHLLNAVQAILAGKIYVGNVATNSQEFAGQTPPSPLAALTNRELEVFEQIGAGYGTAQIAEHMKLSVKTVETHRMHIKQKLKLTTATQLVREALQWSMQDMR